MSEQNKGFNIKVNIKQSLAKIKKILLIKNYKFKVFSDFVIKKFPYIFHNLKYLIE